MKILHVYKSYYPETMGGIELSIHQLCQELHQLGIQSDVAVCAKDTAAKFECKYQVHRYSENYTIASCKMSMKFMHDFARLCNEYDLINYHFPWPFADLMQVVSGSKKPYIVTYQSDIVKQSVLKMIYAPLMHRFLKGAKAIVATSPNYMNSSPILQRYRDKVVCIHPGLSKSSYPLAAPALLEKWKSKLGTDFFLFVGVFRYYKGLKYLIESAQYTDAQIVIAGAGDRMSCYVALAKKLRLTNITFLGLITDSDKYALLTLCRATVSSSHLRSEAFCLSLLEGFMYGKPAISTEIGTGTSFVNQHDKTGVIVQPKKPKALGDAMGRMKNDSDYYQGLLTNIEKHYQDNFLIDRVASAYLGLYQSCRMI
jgi:rhamnosyl/mannosyltransferase